MEMQTFSVDQNKLKNITNANHTSVVAMLRLALRKRDREYVNVSGMQEELIRMGEKVVAEDFTNFWKALENMGVGNFIIGRRGNPDRFKSHYSLKTIAKSAIEGKDEEINEFAKKKFVLKPEVKEEKAVKSEVAPKIRKRGRPRKTMPAERLFFDIPLAKGLNAQVILPKGASKTDIKKVYKTLLR